MFRQRRLLYVQANMLVRKFHHCTYDVKMNLFRAYCTPLYTAPLWVNYKKESLRKLKVAYNDCLRILLKKPRSTRASQLFCNMGLTTFMALLRNLTFKFMSRLDCSTNFIIDLMTDPGRSSVKYTSKIWEHRHECLFQPFFPCIFICIYDCMYLCIYMSFIDYMYCASSMWALSL